MRVISDREVRELLPMAECIDLMADAFASLMRGEAGSLPRQRLVSEPLPDGARYWSHVHLGCMPSLGTAVVRVGSGVLRQTAGERLDFDRSRGRDWGLIYVYDMATGALTGIVQEYSLSAMRVAATTGLAVRYLARPEASSLGLFGAGPQAFYSAQAICRVRPIERVRVYSPTPEHRRRMAAELATELGIACEAVGSPREAVEGADVVSCATNASRPVFAGEWLTPGQLVTCIVNSEGNTLRTEVDARSFERSGAVVVNDWGAVQANRQRELAELVDDGRVSRERVYQLGDLVMGRAVLQPGPGDIVVYKNNVGMPVQFAAACARVVAKAEELNRGTALPDALFYRDLGSGVTGG